MPQRERITFLVRLNDPSIQAKAVNSPANRANLYPVLNVIPHKVPGRAATVGCRYRDGQWWFYDVRTGAPIRPANELDAAAREIEAAVRGPVTEAAGGGGPTRMRR